MTAVSNKSSNYEFSPKGKLLYTIPANYNKDDMSQSTHMLKQVFHRGRPACLYNFPHVGHVCTTVHLLDSYPTNLVFCFVSQAGNIWVCVSALVTICGSLSTLMDVLRKF